MTNAPVVEVEGARELRRTLKRAGDNLADLKAVHAQVGQVVADAARPRTPTLTGRLAGSIRPARLAAGAVVRAGAASIPYGGPIHWGWPARNIEAQPFLSDAATSTEPEWVALYETEVNRIIEEVEGA